MSPKHPCRLATALLLCTLLLAGCHRSMGQKRLYPVSGTVTLDGQPAAYVILHLVPTGPNKGVEARGITKEDGAYELRTYSNEEADGAAPGEYHVILEQFDPVQAVGAKVPATAKPTKIDGGKLPTTKVVKIAGEDANLDIDVQASDKAAPGEVPAGGDSH